VNRPLEFGSFATAGFPKIFRFEHAAMNWVCFSEPIYLSLDPKQPELALTFWPVKLNGPDDDEQVPSTMPGTNPTTRSMLWKREFILPGNAAPTLSSYDLIASRPTLKMVALPNRLAFEAEPHSLCSVKVHARIDQR
jgi:hypothetical protein